MDITAATVALSFGLGLLGFVEPCTIGTHLLFLGAQRTRATQQRLAAVAIFLTARIVVMGGFGGLIVVVGQRLIGVQTGAWLVFGAIYLLLGLGFLFGWERALRHRIGLAPEQWKTASNPLFQGLAFGLNIPACAAPILFGLIGSAVASGSASTGFLMMSVFAVGLSLPLLPLSAVPRLAALLDRLADWLRPRRWLFGAIFFALGIWSIWFGLFVDPADWSQI